MTAPTQGAGHTPGPWKVREVLRGELMGNPDFHEMRIEVCESHGRNDTEVCVADCGPNTASNAANAARIVACVNACDGLSDDDLLLAGRLETSVRNAGGLRAERDRLKAQVAMQDGTITLGLRAVADLKTLNGELVRALDLIAAGLEADGRMVDGMTKTAAAKKARAAIAKLDAPL